jgi:hypothetical protein
MPGSRPTWYLTHEYAGRDQTCDLQELQVAPLTVPLFLEGRAGGAAGHLLTHAARAAFISGADLGLLTAAAAVLAGCVVALVSLPARPRSGDGQPAGGRPPRQHQTAAR